MFGIKKIFIDATHRMIAEHKKETEKHLKDLSIYGKSYRQGLNYPSVKLRLALLDLKITILKDLLNL